MNTRRITGTALFLALALIAQSLRLIIPMPAIVSIFVIGTIVSAIEVLAAWIYSWKEGLILAIVTPLVALVQGFLPFPPLAIVIALASAIYIIMASYWKNRSVIGLYVCSVVGRVAMLFVGAVGVLALFGFPFNKGLAIFMTLGAPQVITAILGLLVGQILYRRLRLSQA